MDNDSGAAQACVVEKQLHQTIDLYPLGMGPLALVQKLCRRLPAFQQGAPVLHNFI